MRRGPARTAVRRAAARGACVGTWIATRANCDPAREVAPGFLNTHASREKLALSSIDSLRASATANWEAIDVRGF